MNMLDNRNASTILYHQSGCKVEIPLPMPQIPHELSSEEILNIYRSIDNLLAAGFTVDPPSEQVIYSYAQVNAKNIPGYK
jgi:hypothetical protein